MAYTDRAILNSIALITFLASIVTMMKGNFSYPLELFLIAMLGVLLILAANAGQENASSSLLYVLFFLASTSNILYLYSVAGYMSLSRLGTLAISVIGLALAGTDMMMQPVPMRLQSEVKKLLAAEKKISQARGKIESFKKELPQASQKKTKRKKK